MTNVLIYYCTSTHDKGIDRHYEGEDEKKKENFGANTGEFEFTDILPLPAWVA